jgi:hypothetical protein
MMKYLESFFKKGSDGAKLSFNCRDVLGSSRQGTPSIEKGGKLGGNLTGVGVDSIENLF